MKGSTRLRVMKGLIRYLVGVKNRQIRDERRRTRALEESLRILSAYVALLAEKSGEIRISAEEVGRAIGQCTAQVTRKDGYYLIKVDRKGNICEKIADDEIFEKVGVADDSINVIFVDELNANEGNGGTYVG